MDVILPIQIGTKIVKFVCVRLLSSYGRGLHFLAGLLHIVRQLLVAY